MRTVIASVWRVLIHTKNGNAWYLSLPAVAAAELTMMLPTEAKVEALKEAPVAAA